MVKNTRSVVPPTRAVATWYIVLHPWEIVINPEMIIPPATPPDRPAVYKLVYISLKLLEDALRYLRHDSTALVDEIEIRNGKRCQALSDAGGKSKYYSST